MRGACSDGGAASHDNRGRWQGIAATLLVSRIAIDIPVYIPVSPPLPYELVQIAAGCAAVVGTSGRYSPASGEERA